jgi:hypothetical protein
MSVCVVVCWLGLTLGWALRWPYVPYGTRTNQRAWVRLSLQDILRAGGAEGAESRGVVARGEQESGGKIWK